jgi:hypothetical protein
VSNGSSSRMMLRWSSARTEGDLSGRGATARRGRVGGMPSVRRTWAGSRLGRRRWRRGPGC